MNRRGGTHRKDVLKRRNRAYPVLWMSRKREIRRKDEIGQPVEANASARFLTSPVVNTLAKRETVVLAGEQSAARREEIADRREEVADVRQQTADQREETADVRQKTADQREKIADQREKVVERREEATGRHEKIRRTRRKAVKAKEEQHTQTEAELREANENLVIATVHAQTMKEVAEATTEQMSYMAEHDFLTGLPNRALLTDRLAQSIALAQRNCKKVALMYLDLDHFKQINDSLGHAIGDQLLQSVAKLLHACIRSSDTVSRQGGDEFVVLLPEIEEVQDAIVIADKLIKTTPLPHLIGDHQLHVTLSIGISVYPDGGKNLEALVSNADAAMYHAKQSGRNKYQVFTPAMKAHAATRQSIKTALHRAFDRGEFVLYFQPKVNLQTGTLTGTEALLRWQRSGNRLVLPAQFMSITEDCGLILPIGKWVLREACRQARAWLQAGFNLSQVAVNVSARELLGKDFLAFVRAALDDSGLAPHHLELELTESGIMQDTDTTTMILHTLKDLGVQIAIDNFGTGYSSLSCLRRFPIDTLKIDQSFVQTPDGEAIVRAIIAMGSSLKQRVVAEGIETQQQLAFLQSHNCAEGQGYYFGRPVVAEEFVKLLRA